MTSSQVFNLVELVDEVTSGDIPIAFDDPWVSEPSSAVGELFVLLHRQLPPLRQVQGVIIHLADRIVHSSLVHVPSSSTRVEMI